MVRTGKISHPSLWSESGYNDIQQPGCDITSLIGETYITILAYCERTSHLRSTSDKLYKHLPDSHANGIFSSLFSSYRHISY